MARAAGEQVLGALGGRIRQLSMQLPTPLVVPQDFQHALDAIAEMNRARNGWMISELRAIASFLNARGIEPVVLKGAAALLSGVYADLGDRYLADIDLFVRESEFNAAIEAFREHGFGCEETNPIEMAVGHAYPAMYREGSPEVDIHRYIGLGVCRTVLPASEVWERSIPITSSLACGSVLSGLKVDTVRMRIPCPEHQVIQHVLHAQMHDRYRERIWPSLRTEYEFSQMQQRFGGQLDWDSIRSRFRRNGIPGALELHLSDAAEISSFRYPDKWRMSALTRLRRVRRQALRRVPQARYVDPIYLVQAGVLQRTRRVREIASQPGGWLYLMQKPFTSRFVARLAADFR